MSRAFSLAGLLRLRSIQERQAAENLARANIEARQMAARDRQARAALAATGTDAVDVRTLAAIAASRVAARSQLAELTNLQAEQRRRLDEARAAHSAAKRNALGLEKLEAAHDEREQKRELADEQAAIDEIATSRWTETES
ncbi:flagellar FliJ protein [Paramicrobacterium humi]|uniref:Flagellar FliJ protein n=1 Tax=Paramicrobacterium humi TaxID=640635 RepID=A0A1H4N511_9MICO|nr:hypothetical protein [Microbacterium humi]SEB90104.1 flagellar FliJ protein [Microbacterium humi]